LEDFKGYPSMVFGGFLGISKDGFCRIFRDVQGWFLQDLRDSQAWFLEDF